MYGRPLGPVENVLQLELNMEHLKTMLLADDEASAVS